MGMRWHVLGKEPYVRIALLSTRHLTPLLITSWPEGLASARVEVKKRNDARKAPQQGLDAVPGVADEIHQLPKEETP